MIEAVAVILAWLMWAIASRWLLRNPRGDVETGVIWNAARAYAFGFQRLRVMGREHVPGARRPGALIVVCNHTAGIDPILVSAAVPFEVRWMMGLDMMAPSLKTVWDWTGVIAVNRKGRDLAGTREALRLLEEGAVVGVFPEGRLERPARQLLEFHPGVGFLIARSGASVLPVWIDGTPQVDPAWASLRKRGRARVTFGAVRRFDGQDAKEITRELRAWFAEVSGWRR